MPFDLVTYPVREPMAGKPIKVGFPKDPPPDTFAGLHDLACECARVSYLLHGKVPATWLLDVAGRLILIRSEWDSEQDKIAISRFLPGFMNVLGVQRYSFISEVYVAMYERQGGDERLPSERPAAERDEVLLIGSETATDLLMSRFLITQRPGRAFPLLGPRVDIEEGADHFTGRMFGMLRADKKPSPANLRAAREFLEQRIAAARQGQS